MKAAMKTAAGRRVALALLATLLLGACGSGEQEELRQWMADESRNMRGKVPPLPEVKPYAPVPYDSAHLVDPFRSARISAEQKMRSGGLQPDLDRPREPLESHPLESIRFVGAMTKEGQWHGIVQAGGALHQVRVGNHAGQDYGVIVRISETEIDLRELVQDPAGDWVERAQTLHLQAREGR
ncbi:MAG: pilus assembly protein PilP [Azospira sp.]|jgi:type IV pilus assembly protein PilP|nr:pilus assembly protein PilP [Azospira sp.]